MILTGLDKKFRLEILGYEFSTSEFIEDLNWLNINIDVSSEDFSWQAKGSYLKSNELFEIYNWFITINQEKQIKERLNFLEHELSFSYDKLNRELTIYLDFNFHPKGIEYDYNNDSEYSIIFSLDEINIKSIIKSLKSYTKTYPIRFDNIQA